MRPSVFPPRSYDIGFWVVAAVWVAVVSFFQEREYGVYCSMTTQRPPQAAAAAIDVAYVAHLARLELSDDEANAFQRQLSTVVQYMQQIAEVDLSDIEPTSHGQAVYNVMRTDTSRPGLDREVVLANAPRRSGDTFQVPKIVE